MSSLRQQSRCLSSGVASYSGCKPCVISGLRTSGPAGTNRRQLRLSCAMADGLARGTRGRAGQRARGEQRTYVGPNFSSAKGVDSRLPNSENKAKVNRRRVDGSCCGPCGARIPASKSQARHHADDGAAAGGTGSGRSRGADRTRGAGPIARRRHCARADLRDHRTRIHGTHRAGPRAARRHDGTRRAGGLHRSARSIRRGLGRLRRCRPRAAAVGSWRRGTVPHTRERGTVPRAGSAGSCMGAISRAAGAGASDAHRARRLARAQGHRARAQRGRVRRGGAGPGRRPAAGAGRVAVHDVAAAAAADRVERHGLRADRRSPAGAKRRRRHRAARATANQLPLHEPSRHQSRRASAIRYWPAGTRSSSRGQRCPE